MYKELVFMHEKGKREQQLTYSEIVKKMNPDINIPDKGPALPESSWAMFGFT